MSWIGIEREPVTTREQLINEIQVIFRYYDFHNKGTLWLEEELNRLLDEYDEDFYCADESNGGARKCQTQCKYCKI